VAKRGIEVCDGNSYVFAVVELQTDCKTLEGDFPLCVRAYTAFTSLLHHTTSCVATTIERQRRTHSTHSSDTTVITRWTAKKDWSEGAT